MNQESQQHGKHHNPPDRDGEASRSDTVISNLRAFARLYGYVRFFHPSDEASAIDWDRFAILGSRKTKEAQGPAELRGALENLFRPIAPTLQLYGADENPHPFPRSGLANGLKTVHWNHHGVGLHHNHLAYRSHRPGRWSPDGVKSRLVFQQFSSDRYAGKEVKVSIYARTDCPDRSDLPGLWLSSQPPYAQFKNLVAVPITTTEWQQYNATVRLPADCSTLSIGCYGGGAGTVWADEIELAVRDEKGEWIPEKVEDSGFESDTPLDDSPHWYAFKLGARSSFTTQGPFRGKQCLMIETDTSAFINAVHLKAGESVDKEIAPGLFSRVPLALHSDDEHTLPRADAEEFTRLKAELDAIDVAALTPGDQDLRLADVAIVWNVLQHFYPYFDVVPADWDSALTSALEHALADKDRADFLHTLRLMAAALHDGHGFVNDPATRAWGQVPARLELVEGRAMAIAAEGVSGLLKGDEVLEINGRPIQEAIAEALEISSGSPQFRQACSVRRILRGPVGDTFRFLVVRGKDTLAVSAVAVKTPATAVPPDQGESIRQMAKDIWYVDLTRAPMAAIDSVMDGLAKARGVVFDLRGYPKGNHDVISHLLTGKEQRGEKWMWIPRIVYPDHERVESWDGTGWAFLQPKEPHLKGKIVFLIDGDVVSYAESFMGYIEGFKLAEIVGSPTAGTNGDVNPIELPGGYTFFWTGLRVTKFDGSQHHLIGIQPTVPLERTLKAVLEGRDEFVEKAVELINRSR